MKRFQSAVALALMLAAQRAGADAPELTLATESMRVAFAPSRGDPTSWEVCHPTCAAAQSRETFRVPSGASLVVAGNANETRRMAAPAYHAQRHDDANTLVLTFVSEPLADGIVLRKTWRIPRRGYEGSVELALEGQGALAFAEAHPLEVAIDGGAAASAVELGAWRGVRSRFWALLVHSDPRRAAIGGAFRIYSGPIEWSLLRATDPELDGLLFAHLWFWMRWLAFGLLLLLDVLCALIRNAGIAIMALALCVKILMRPISALAERWQREVNELSSRLRPGIEAIKASARGVERSQRLLALHREHGVTPFYGLRSLLSVAIQLPIFFAAYHALDEAFVLAGVPFLWIADLAEPDRIAAFPHPLPFFGDSLNLLPFVMSAVTLLSSRLHDDGTLAPELLRRQRLGLYGLALAFFLLFYSFPAGMVLYWTTNNLVALVWQAVSRRLPHKRDRRWRLALGSIWR